MLSQIPPGSPLLQVLTYFGLSFILQAPLGPKPCLGLTVLASAQGRAGPSPTGGSHGASLSRERKVDGGTKPANHCEHRCATYQRACQEIKGPERTYPPTVGRGRAGAGRDGDWNGREWERERDGGSVVRESSCEVQAGRSLRVYCAKAASPRALACTAFAIIRP